jgi:hypothetical protein
MKNIFIAVLLLFAIGAQAQVLYTFTRPTSATLDTIVNTGSVELTFILRGAYDSAAFQVNVAEAGSYTTAGSCICQHSVNGTTYVTMSTVGDTLALTDVATQGKIWTLTNPAYPYYKIKCTGSGTMKAVATAKAHLKKK